MCFRKYSIVFLLQNMLKNILNSAQARLRTFNALPKVKCRKTLLPTYTHAYTHTFKQTNSRRSHLQNRKRAVASSLITSWITRTKTKRQLQHLILSISLCPYNNLCWLCNLSTEKKSWESHSLNNKCKKVGMRLNFLYAYLMLVFSNLKIIKVKGHPNIDTISQ